MNEPQPGPDQAAGPNQLPGPYLAPTAVRGRDRLAGRAAAAAATRRGPAAVVVSGPLPGAVRGPLRGPLSVGAASAGPLGHPARSQVPVSHSLARTASHRWWRPILGTAAIIAVFLVLSIFVGLVAFVVSLVTGVPMVRTGTRLFADPVLDLGFQLGVIALLLPLVLGAAWLLQRRPPGSLVALRLRWRWMGACLLVALVAVVLGQVVEAMTLLSAGVDTGFRWAGWGEFLPAIIVVLLLVPFQSAAGVRLTVGAVIQGFGAYLRNPWPAILVGAAAFAASHGYTGWGIVYVFAFGMLMGWLAVRTGGLEAPIALTRPTTSWRSESSRLRGTWEARWNRARCPGRR